MFAEAARLQHENKLADRRAPLKRCCCSSPIMPRRTTSRRRVVAQGKRAEASPHFAQALTLMPQLFDQYNGVCETLAAVLPPMARRCGEPSPLANFGRRRSTARRRGLLRGLRRPRCCSACCQSTPARNFARELVLHVLRAALLAESGASQDEPSRFLARAGEAMLSMNYVFAVTPMRNQVARAQGGDQ